MQELTGLLYATGRRKQNMLSFKGPEKLKGLSDAGGK